VAKRSIELLTALCGNPPYDSARTNIFAHHKPLFFKIREPFPDTILRVINPFNHLRGRYNRIGVGGYRSKKARVADPLMATHRSDTSTPGRKISSFIPFIGSKEYISTCGKTKWCRSEGECMRGLSGSTVPLKRAGRRDLSSLRPSRAYRTMTESTADQNDTDASIRERTLDALEDPDRKRRYRALTDIYQTHLNEREWSQ